MSNDTNYSVNVEDEVDFKEIIKILIESKKLIISTILIFTIACVIWTISLTPLYKTSTKFEIGFIELESGERKLVESASDVVSDLKILVLKNPNKFTQNVSIGSIEKRIIRLETTSSSAEQNENLLTEMNNYIYDRHSKIVISINKLRQDKISSEIDSIESELSFLNEKIKIDKENTILELEIKISKLQNDIPILDHEISQLETLISDNKILKNSNARFNGETRYSTPTLEEIISNYKSQINYLKRERIVSISDLDYFSRKLNTVKMNRSKSDTTFNLIQRKTILENKLQMLMAQTIVNTSPIGDIKTNTIKPKAQLIISLGIICGFITSILLIFIRNFVRRYKDSQA